MPSAALAEENEKTWQNKISDHVLRLHSTRHQPSRSALYWKHKQFTQTPRGYTMPAAVMSLPNATFDSPGEKK